MKTLYVMDIDGTVVTSGGPIMLETLAKLPFWGVLSSRSVTRSREVLPKMRYDNTGSTVSITGGMNPLFIQVCRVDMRAEELKLIKEQYPGYGRYVYVADREIDRQETLLAGWNFCFARNFKGE